MSFWTEVTMHSALFLGFLTGFYFLFVTNIQTESLVNDLVNVAKQNLTLKAAFSTPDQINTAISQFDNELPGSIAVSVEGDFSNISIAVALANHTGSSNKNRKTPVILLKYQACNNGGSGSLVKNSGAIGFSERYTLPS